MTKETLRRNQEALAHAVAQQRLEGLTVSVETMQEMQRVVHGETTTQAVIEGIYKRVNPNVPIFQPR